MQQINAGISPLHAAQAAAQQQQMQQLQQQQMHQNAQALQMRNMDATELRNFAQQHTVDLGNGYSLYTGDPNKPQLVQNRTSPADRGQPTPQQTQTAENAQIRFIEQELDKEEVESRKPPKAGEGPRALPEWLRPEVTNRGDQQARSETTMHERREREARRRLERWRRLRRGGEADNQGAGPTNGSQPVGGMPASGGIEAMANDIFRQAFSGGGGMAPRQRPRPLAPSGVDLPPDIPLWQGGGL